MRSGDWSRPAVGMSHGHGGNSIQLAGISTALLSIIKIINGLKWFSRISPQGRHLGAVASADF